MIHTEIIERLREYTRRQMPVKRYPAYDYGGNLYAEDVFEEGTDIYINLHTKEVNSISGSLHGHDFFELNYVIRGTCHQIIEDCSITSFGEGSVCIMNPNARHNIRAESDEDLILNIGLKISLFTSTFWALLEQNECLGQFFLDYFMAMDQTSHFMLFKLEPDSHLEWVLEEICREYLEQGPYSQLTLRCNLIVLFTDIIRLQTKQLSNRKFTDKTSVRITALFQYLSINYATATLGSTAAYFHYHPNYLSSFIKKNTGKTFRSILNDIKLSQANYYLLNTNMAIKDISEHLGFSQLCNFYDFIRKNYGVTPVEYRRTHNQ